MSDKKQEEDSLFWQIFSFIDDLVVGEGKEFDSGLNIPSTMMSKNTLEAIQMKVSNIVEKHTQMVDQSITVNKNIYIDCGSAPITGHLLEKGNYKDGKKNGLWEYYHKDGSLNKTETYINGEKQK